MAERKSKLGEMESQVSTKILVVDDDEVMLRLVSQILQDEGYQISSFSDPKEALDKIKKDDFDLVVADIKMPEIDGIELIKRAHRLCPNLGALFMTGYASVKTAQEAVKEGAYDYILKPFDLEEIKGAVEKALDRRKEQLGRVKSGDLAWLYDLNKLLSSTMERKGLLKLLLGLALSHCKLTNGSIFIWDRPSEGLEIFVTKDLRSGEFTEDRLKTPKQIIESWSKMSDYVGDKDINCYPILEYLSSQGEKTMWLDDVFPPKDHIISIPIERRENLVGLLNLNQKTDQTPPDATKIKLLSVVTSQTLISLENLRLFQETQKSYLKLQDLQDQIVALEKGAIEAHRSAQIGHDINNFLMIIKGFFQLLLVHIDRDDKAKINKSLKAMEENLAKAETFAKNLMDFRSQKGEKTECDINDFVEKVISFLKPQRRFQSINFQKALDKSAPPIFVEVNQMQQLLYNLLNNAADAINCLGKGGGDISIETVFDKEDDLLELCIADSGKGMSEEELRKAFQIRFTTKQDGHGLGLLACNKIVENHGGKIEVKSKVGEGTSFKIKLPCHPEKSQ